MNCMYSEGESANLGRGSTRSSSPGLAARAGAGGSLMAETLVATKPAPTTLRESRRQLAHPDCFDALTMLAE